MSWSKYQSDVFEFVEHGEGSAVVEAVAGSGKTTTIVEAAKRLPGNNPEALFLAFNKSIAEELKTRLPKTVRASTLNSLGWTIWTGHAGRFVKVDGNKVRAMARENLTDDERFLEGSAIKLVGLAKSIGLVPRDFPRATALVADQDQVWAELADRHDLEFDKPEHLWEAVRLARMLLSLDIRRGSQVVDYDDQIYLPVIQGVVPQRRYDWVIVDEAQDLSPIQRALVRKVLRPGGRLLAVGDPYQAIYGFRGADSQSINAIVSEFGCRRLPLSTTYRCARSIVDYAQRVVPHIEASPTAPEGVVECWPSFLGGDFVAGDLVVCRNTAPLISLAYGLLAQRVPVKVMGREIGEGLVALVNRLKPKGLEGENGLIAKLERHRAAETEKAIAKGNETKADTINDKVDSLLAIIQGSGCQTVPQLLRSIEAIFEGSADRCVVLATIHKAKGLEADRVFVLDDWRMPSRWARQDWQKEQERNLAYVAYTRAKTHLVFITLDRLESAQSHKAVA